MRLVGRFLAEAIGAELRRVREARAMTQVEISIRLGITQPTVSKIEKGTTGISLGQFTDWCDACEVSASDVVARIDRVVRVKS